MSQNKTINAPVILFVYKRPDHTLKIIEKINQVNIKKVYIIADGWKSSNDKSAVEKTRNLIKDINSNVEKIFFNKNIGLRKNAEIGRERTAVTPETGRRRSLLLTRTVLSSSSTAPTPRLCKRCQPLLFQSKMSQAPTSSLT